MQSMTGFGQAKAQMADQACTIEIRSVNHRFLDVKFRFSSGHENPAFEQKCLDQLQKQIKRGSVQVTIKWNHAQDYATKKELNSVLFLDYAGLFVQAQQLCKTVYENTESISSSQPTWPILHTSFLETCRFALMQPGVIVSKNSTLDNDELHQEYLDLFSIALAEFIAQRTREGSRLKESIELLIKEMLTIVEQLKHQSETLSKEHHRILVTKLSMLLNSSEHMLNKDRLTEEVALIASQTDVHEEIIRLEIHLNEILTICRKEEPIGRALDFLSQEIHREINTMGQKSQSMILTSSVLALKAALERVREQIQNVE